MGIYVEEYRKVLSTQNGIAIPQENQQSKLTETLEALRLGTNNQSTYMSWAQASPTYIADMQLGHHVGPKDWSEGYPKATAYPWICCTNSADSSGLNGKASTQPCRHVKCKSPTHSGEKEWEMEEGLCKGSDQETIDELNLK